MQLNTIHHETMKRRKSKKYFSIDFSSMARSCTHGFPATASFSLVVSTCSSRHPWVVILCMSLRDSTGGRFFVPPVPRIPSKKSASVYDRSPLVEKIQGNTFCLVHFNRIFLFVWVWDIKLSLKVFLSF